LGRFIAAFSLILLANLLLASALVYAQTRAAASAELGSQLEEVAKRAVTAYQRRSQSNLTNMQWAADTNLNAGLLSTVTVYAYEAPSGSVAYDPQNGWSDPRAAALIGSRASQVLAGRQAFWLDAQSAYLAVPVEMAASQTAILLLGLPRQLSVAMLLDFGRPVLFTLLAVSLPTLLLAFVIIRQMTRPVSQMVRVADAIAGGDLRQRAAYTANNEIGSLGQALNQMAAQLAAADQARTLLVRGISHDLRTPLTTIKANTQALADGLIREEDKPELLADTIAETDRLRGLVDNLLLASGQGSAWPLCLERHDLAELARRTAAQMQVLAGQAGKSLQTDLPASLVWRVDARQIRQALVNLIDNAVRYSPAGSAITVRLRREPGAAVLAVHDPGPGVPLPLRDKIFDPLVKGENSSGSGLGLYICRRIAEAHDGRISLASCPGSGTCVQLWLPDEKGGADFAD
jgi:signal transduction histidine kinase